MANDPTTTPSIGAAPPPPQPPMPPVGRPSTADFGGMRRMNSLPYGQQAPMPVAPQWYNSTPPWGQPHYPWMSPMQMWQEHPASYHNTPQWPGQVTEEMGMQPYFPSFVTQQPQYPTGMMGGWLTGRMLAGPHFGPQYSTPIPYNPAGGPDGGGIPMPQIRPPQYEPWGGLPPGSQWQFPLGQSTMGMSNWPPVGDALGSQPVHQQPATPPWIAPWYGQSAF